ncbi:MAG: fibronectin type III domain-containing protein [Acidobacteriota bacterium]
MRYLMALIYLAFSLSCFSITLTGQPTASAESDPHLPTLLATTYTSPTGQTIFVDDGGDLQAALDQAQAGDQVVLKAGATYIGNFVLPLKSGSDYIHIRTSTADEQLSTPGIRITPQQANLMPKIITTNSVAAIRTAARAHHYRLIGLEIAVAEDVELNYGIVWLGDGSQVQNSLDLAPHDLIIDRCYIHGNSSGTIFRGIALNSATTAIIDSYISQCHGEGFDTQAICGWNGPGPFKIVNNYLEGAGENVLFGGADPAIENLIPSDIEFRRNHCFKPLSWKIDDPSYAGIHWTIKNLLELKNAQRVLIDGNILENNWPDGQNGFAILFTPRNQDGASPWSVVQDVTFSNNILRHVAAGINILGTDDIYPSQRTQRIKIINNLFQDMGGDKWKGRGRFLQLLAGTINVTVENNTIFQATEIIVADGEPTQGFIYRNNIAPHNEYGIIGTDAGPGNSTIARFFPNGIFEKNIIIGNRIADLYTSVPNNFFPESLEKVGFIDLARGNLQLSANSPYKSAGVANIDPGADIDKIEKAISGADRFVPVSVTSTGATISWSIDLPDTIQIEYGPTAYYGNTITLAPGVKGVTLLGLPMDSFYYYRIKTSKKNGNYTIWGSYIFTTLLTYGIIDPVIKTEVVDTQATITWTTSTATTSQIEYGKTTTYGKTGRGKKKLSTSHRVKLKGLATTTTYHYRIRSQDKAGNLIVSPDLNFSIPEK